MELGIIGLGKMGLNICRRLIQGGHSVVVFDSDSEVLKIAQKENISTGNSLEDLVKKLTKPRILWMMVPSGEITHSTILNLSDLLDRGDIIIDGGNSYYKDTQSMAYKLSEKGIKKYINREEYRILNTDLTIILQSPSVKKYNHEIRCNLSKILNIGLDQISLKATTTDKLGFIGQKERIGVLATT